MNDFNKVNSMQLYNLWKNLIVGLVTVIAMMTFSKLLPFYFSPVIAIIGAAFLYVYLFGTKMSWGSSCMIIPYAMMYSQLAYAFVTILLNVLYAWGVKMIPSEIIFLKIPLFHRWCLIQSRL